MTVLGQTALTLADHAKRMDPSGKIGKIVELLSQTNQILDDALWLEGNLPTGHQTNIRTGLPDVYWRLVNGGVQPSKSTAAQITEGCGMLEAWSQVDEVVAKLNGNLAQFRMSEARPFVESMNNEMGSTLFYGNSSVSPEEFNGLSIRYSSTSAANGQNIIKAGGSDPSDNSSIWLVVWGDQTCHGIFPKGSKAGLDHQDFGLDTIENAGGVTGALMRAYRERWKWDAGLVVKDWRYVVRIANIDMSALIAQSGQANLITMMTKAMHRIPNLGMGRPAFYMNRSLAQYLDIQRQADVKSGGGLTYENVDGKNVLTFRKVPIRICDGLLETEAAIS
jgi:hypothetical protein